VAAGEQGEQAVTEQAGVERAARIFADHGDFIRRIIRYHVPDEAAADDLFQDFFLSLVASDVPADMENIRGYLYKAITNDVADSTRRVKNYRSRVNGYAERVLSHKSVRTPEDLSAVSEQADIVSQLIDRRLSDMEARAVALRYDGHYDISQTAQRLGINPRTASRYISTAIAKIRDFFSLRTGGDDEFR